MDLFFFHNEPPRNDLRYKNCCFFWYEKSLYSYKEIDTVLDIDKIFIESTIYNDFSEDYSEIVLKYSVEIVSGNVNLSVKRAKKQICFFASNDTIVFSLKNVAVTFDKFGLFSRKEEGAKLTAEKLGLSCEDVVYRIPDMWKYNVLVLSNDWGGLERKINNDFINDGKNSICIQESVIDFNPKDMRMQNCCIPIFQGIVSLKNLDLIGKVCAVIGNPRYEELKQIPLPNTPKALVNVNFTYGIHEDVRNIWLKDVIESCNSLKIPYLISQHPRDQSDLSAYNANRTNASNVHDLMKESSFLITRFSSLIHESLLLGRPVIYYNPHREDIFYDFEPDSINLFIVYTKKELIDVVNTLINNDKEFDSQKYLNRHIGAATDGKASFYISNLLSVLLIMALSKRER